MRNIKSEMLDIELAKLEDANDNNELLRVIASELGFDDLEEKIAHMKAVHRSIGNMPHHLYMEREQYRKEIKERGVNHPNWESVKSMCKNMESDKKVAKNLREWDKNKRK
ncbi:MAG: hypothetical protein CL489_08995 [Acidobacteria bacterium]|nr:hypothetical protein [Acidobacteriota bacterium]|tara:strand:- start:32407 stop:32736 length:330 start_codon:yes stop_codon:yes gene_type:complete